MKGMIVMEAKMSGLAGLLASAGISAVRAEAMLPLASRVAVSLVLPVALIFSALVIFSDGPATAAVVETTSLSGSIETITFDSLTANGSTPLSTVTTGGDTFSATSPSSIFILSSCGSACGITSPGITNFLHTDNAATFTTPDNLTITPSAGVTEIGLTYGTFNEFGKGSFQPLTISATVNTTSGPTDFTLTNNYDVEQFVGFSSTSAITSVVLSGLAPQAPFRQSTEIDLIETAQNAVSPTPLPGTVVLFGSGLLSLIGFARLRSRNGVAA
jgi:hypothetical protein